MANDVTDNMVVEVQVKKSKPAMSKADALSWIWVARWSIVFILLFDATSNLLDVILSSNKSGWGYDVADVIIAIAGVALAYFVGKRLKQATATVTKLK